MQAARIWLHVRPATRVRKRQLFYQPRNSPKGELFPDNNWVAAAVLQSFGGEAVPRSSGDRGGKPKAVAPKWLEIGAQTEFPHISF
jgi:hypothetical protein